MSEPAAGPREPLPSWLRLALMAAIAFRIGYHAVYFGEVPFVLAPFSDGAMYEKMALDILDQPPWGSAPFYLQGIYGAFMAVAMAIRAQPSTVLILQLLVAAVGWWALFRALQAVTDRRGAALVILLGLAYPGLAFYENKHLTATLAVVSFMVMLRATASVMHDRRVRGAAWLGAATALAVLVRSNALVAVPFVGWAVVLAARTHRRPAGPRLAAFGAGLLVVLAPMAIRNAVVTGEATVMPAHGGGTSFYIGNNAEARGVWNDAGGLLSGDVSHERGELARRLGIEVDAPAAEAEAIGRALYARAFREMADDPARWIWLEVRKTWLMLGNDELTQDYDRLGERELVGAGWHVGVPFGVLLGLVVMAVVGARGRERSLTDRVWGWVLWGQAVAVVVANLGFFTSAQHRLPLVVPMLGYLAWARPDRAWREARRRRRIAMAVFGLLTVGLAAWPRSRQEAPTAVHYFNLALAQKRIGDPRGALRSLSRAIERRPDHVVIRIERATLARELGDEAMAREDLAWLGRQTELPAWVRRRVARERQWLPSE